MVVLGYEAVVVAPEDGAPRSISKELTSTLPPSETVA